MFVKIRKYFPSWILLLVIALFLMSGCSGGEGSTTNSLGSSSGIAVDPYITGAVFQEVAASGAVLQESNPSDENGLFQFPHALTLGSTIRIKATARGMHNNLPFSGILKRLVDDSGTLVVSPLTTLLANDLTEAEVLSFFHDAGLTGLSTADLYADPMKGLNSLLAVNDDDLVNLQAAIAVNKFMLLLGDYDMPKEEILLHGEEMANMVQLVKQVVNSLILGATLEEISGPMANAQVTPTMGAPISAGANLIDTVVAGFMADPLQDPLVAAEEKLAYLSELALIYSVQANRGLQGVEDEITLGNLPEIDANFTPDITELQNALEGSKGPVTAEAGLNQNVTVGNEVFLSGSFIFNVNQAHSFINLGDSSNGISFFWAFESKPAASSAQLTDKRSQFPSFTADEAGTYVLRLTVFNQGVAGTTDTVTIYASRVENLPPVANSGTDQHITTGDTVMLNGSASFDNDGDLLSYFWAFESIPAGSGALLSDSSVVNPTFLADIDGTYIVSLTVNDGLVDSVPVSVIVTAASGNVAPVAAAGSNQNIPVGTTVTLNGSTSSDADNDSLIYSWSLTVKPAGSSAALSNISVVNPSFVADLAGTYQVQLVVNDGSVDSAPDSVSVTASSTNVPPVANGGTNQNVAVNSTVSLDGSGSSDADNDLLSYSWSFTEQPIGSVAALSSISAVNPSFTADLAGTYTIRLIVNDGTTNSTPASVTVTAAKNNVPPTANAGLNQDVFVFDLVNLDGSGSSDPDNDPLTYSWLITSKPAGSSATLSATNVDVPSFVADLAGSYTIRLVVNDGTVDSAPATVTVTASSSNVAPTANAGIDQNVTAGNTVNLDGSGSNDPDGDLLTYSWSFTSIPTGSTATILSSTVAAPSFTADLPGSYVLKLVVNDGTVDSTPDTVTVTAAAAPTNCTACHDQPPTVGAHTVHTGLPSVNGDCSTCHLNNNHMNGTVDVNFDPIFSAQSGGAPAWNGTSCDSVSCHGGQTTPDFFVGSISVNTECTSCHTSGTTQYNSYNSGKHTFHLGFITCTSCHNTSTLALTHFSSLDTTQMEGPASATIGGGSTSISSYDATQRTCTIACHGTNKAW